MPCSTRAPRRSSECTDRSPSCSSSRRHARAEGTNELKDGLPLLTAIRVHYRLRIAKGTREVVDRALSRHQDKCPTAATLKPAVAVSWTAEIEEV